jgi:DNA-binding LacI/PurR family transcriptional regulator
VVTMHDVARAAGVSQAAVSYAFNRPDRLSNARREHILKIATEIGYAGPDPAGRSLRTGQAGALGLMITDSLRDAFDDPATALLLRGISEVGELAEVALTLLPFPLESQKIAQGSGVLLRGAVDGFLAYALPEGHPGMERVLSRGLPVVLVDGVPDTGLPRVGIPDRQAARELAAQVLAHGHRRVGVLVDRLVPDGRAGVASAARIIEARDRVMSERLIGYGAAFDDHGDRDWSTVTIVEAGGVDHGVSLRAAETLLDAAAVTAVIAGTDVLALATIEVARGRGLAVPDDLSVVGFDDIPAAEAAGLTTVRQPLVDKGRQAARLLLEIIDGGPAREILLPVEYVRRASLARPPRP